MIGAAARVHQALELAREAAPDAAVLDVNLAGERVFPLATALREWGVPFALHHG